MFSANSCLTLFESPMIFIAEVFDTKDVPYNLRSSNNLVLPSARSSLYGTDTNRFIGQKLWQTLPREM